MAKYDDGPYLGGIAITPGTALTKPVRAIMATAAGNVNITMVDGSTLIVPINANTIYPLMVTAVASGSTTATGLFGFV